MKKKKIQCANASSRMKCVLKRHDSSSTYKEGEIFADGTENNKVEVHMFPKDVKSVEDAQKNGVLEKYFNESPEKLDPVYKEVIRLIYREEIPK